MDNLTRSERLLELTSEVYAVDSVIKGDIGDRIQISAAMWGGGNSGANARTSRVYSAYLETVFFVPEPGAAWLLAIGGLLVGTRRGRWR